MRRSFFLTLAVFLICHFNIVKAQPNNRIGIKQVDWCGTVPYTNSLEQAFPIAFQEALFEMKLQEFQNSLHSKRTNDDELVYRIPVVVHVIHQGEPVGIGSNLSFKQVASQIAALNDDFRRRGLGFNDHESGADTQIEFYLAPNDPFGNKLSEPGIDRVEYLTDWTRKRLEYKLKPETYWNPYKYLNIWVVDFPDWLGFSGYAQFPINSGLDGLEEQLPEYTDGVLIKSKYFGKVGSATEPYDLGRITTHEVGHWLGLRHIWGDGDCSKDDYCEDTPTAEAPNRVCVENYSCDSRDMIENYMDYTPDRCKNIFTMDQKARMRTVLAMSPMRKELVQATSECASAMVVGEGSYTTQSLPQYYTYTATQDEVLSVSNVGINSANTLVEIFDSCDGELLTANDDAGGSVQSALTYIMHKEEQVLIRWDNVSGGDQFTWELSTHPIVDGNTCDRSIQVQQGVNEINANSDWVWYQYKVASSGEKLQLDAAGAAIDVFVGTCGEVVPYSSGHNSISVYGLHEGDMCYILLSGSLPESWSLEMKPLESGESCLSPVPVDIGANAFQGKEYWASFTTPAPGDILFYDNNDDSDEQILLEVYRGCDDEPIGVSDLATFRVGNAGANETYLVKWSDLGDGSGFDWVIGFHEDPYGENCHVTLEASEEHNAYEVTEEHFELWFRYIMPEYPSMLTFDFGDASSLESFDLYSGADCNELEYIYTITPFPWNDSPLLEPFDTIYLVWEVDEGMLLDWDINVWPQKPGDSCDDPHESNEGINESPGEYMNCWTTFTMPRSGNLTITSVGLTDLDTKLEAYSDCGDIHLIASNDDADDTHQSTLSFDGLHEGEKILFHWSNEFDNEPIKWKIEIDEDVQEGALCGTAHHIESFSEDLEAIPGHWYRASVPENGTVFISSDQHTVEDTYLQVYGSCELNLLGESDDIDLASLNFQSKIRLDQLTAGDELLIYWSDQWSSELFHWEIMMSDDVPLANDQHFEISEKSQVGDLIGLIEVANENSDGFVYQILQGDDFAKFELDDTSGELYLVGDLDYDVQQEFILLIEIANEDFSTEIEVIIHVIEEIVLMEPHFSDMEVYPNPVGDELWISLGDNLTGDARLINLCGQEVSIFKVPGNARIDLKELNAGVYILWIEVGEEQFTKKIIKK